MKDLAGEHDPVSAFLGRSTVPLSRAAHAASAETERSLAGLQQLAQRYEWGAVLELGTALLSRDNDIRLNGGVVPGEVFQESERLLCVAYQGLAYLQTGQLRKAVEVVENSGFGGTAMEEFGDEWDVVEHERNVPNTISAPFEMRMLALEVQLRQGNSEVIERCYRLMYQCRREAESPRNSLSDRRLWAQRESLVLSAVVKYHLQTGNYGSAVDVLRVLVDLHGRRSDVLYLYGRVLIHVGDYTEARAVIDQANEHPDSKQFEQRIHLGLLYGATGKLNEAIAEYDAVCQLRAGGVFAARVNKAACLIQLGQLRQAIDILEALLKEDPIRALDEDVVSNLCTLYGLAYPARADEKKNTLRRVAARYSRQGFHMGSIN